MVRKLLSGRVGLAVAAALGLAGLTSSSNAAEITFSLRATGGAGIQSGDGKSVQLDNGAAGQVVQLGLYAQIQNNDSNHANDGFRLVHTALTSTEALVGGAVGNIAPVSINSVYTNANPSLQAPGTAQNLDGNAVDLEVGGLSTAAAPGWIIVSNGNSANFGTGAGAGVTEFLLGTTTWTSSLSPVPSNTALNFFLRVRTDGNPVGQQLVQYTTDGTARSLRADAANIAVGDVVNISIVPEPASLGLLGVGALAALRRRRSM